MRPRNRGVIVNVGSAMAYRSIPLQSVYCGVKHVVVGFTESVMTELAHEKSNIKLCMVQLPGLNTTQFNWNLNKMPKHPMPVAPIFQSELPAKATAFLAEHPRRNMWVGVSTAYTILGERLGPKLVDLYLGRTGVSGQQTGQDMPRWGSNVFEPQDQDQDRGAHGPSTARRTPRTPCCGCPSTAAASSAGSAPAPPPRAGSPREFLMVAMVVRAASIDRAALRDALIAGCRALGRWAAAVPLNRDAGEGGCLHRLQLQPRVVPGASAQLRPSPSSA